ncbi:addiction module protein [Desulfobacterota bacterium M19]
MATELEQCEQHAMKLSIKEKALLIKRLIQGLDELDEQKLEKLWVEEAARRFNEFEAGNIKARPAKDVFCDARARLQEV